MHKKNWKNFKIAMVKPVAKFGGWLAKLPEKMETKALAKEMKAEIVRKWREKGLTESGTDFDASQLSEAGRDTLCSNVVVEQKIAVGDGVLHRVLPHTLVSNDKQESCVVDIKSQEQRMHDELKTGRAPYQPLSEDDEDKT